MNLKFKVNGKFVTYTEDEVKLLNRDELKQIMRELQCNIEDVSAKRADYNASNKEEFNSNAYHKQIASFKTVTANLRKQMSYVSSIIKDVAESDLSKREHWLWCFYMNTKNSVNSLKFNKIVKYTDERAKFHIDVKGDLK